MKLVRLKKNLLRLRGYLKSITYRRIIGKDSYIDSSVQVLGWRFVNIGYNSYIGESVWLNTNERGPEADMRIIIGNNVFIGRDCFVSAGKLITFCDYSLIAKGCQFLGSNHIFNDPFVPYSESGTTIDRSIYIGVNCWLGNLVTVIGNVKIGHGSIVGACSVVTKDVPPFSIVVGNPATIIKRYDFNKKCWIPNELYLEKDESNLPNEPDYLKILQEKVPYVSQSVHAASSRFGDVN